MCKIGWSDPLMKKVHNGSRFPLWSRLLGHQMLLAPTHFFTLWCFTRDEHTTLTTAIHRMGGRPSLSKRSDNYWHLLNYQGLVGELPWLVLAPPFLCLACYSGWLMTQPWTRNHPAKKKEKKKAFCYAVSWKPKYLQRIKTPLSLVALQYLLTRRVTRVIWYKSQSSLNRFELY